MDVLYGCRQTAGVERCPRKNGSDDIGNLTEDILEMGMEGSFMKKKYLLLIGILAICCMLGGCKKKKDADKVTAEPTIITKEDSVSGQVVEMQQGDQIDKSKITNIMGTQTATSGDLVITNATGAEISAFYAKLSDDEDWGDDLIAGRFTLKNNDRALFYYEKGASPSSGAAATKYDLMVSFADPSEEDDCYFRELTLGDIQELSLNIDADGGVPYVKYQSLATKQQISTLSAARKRMGLSDLETDISGNKTDRSTQSQPRGTSDRSGINTDTGSSGSAAATDQPADDDDTGTGTGTVPADPQPTTQPTDPNNGGDVVPPGDGQGQDMRETAQGYVGQDMDSLVGEVGTANATEYGTDDATGDTIVYHYYDGFTVSTVEGEDGGQTVTGIW